MTKENIYTGGPAFPNKPCGDIVMSESGVITHQFPGNPGMTLRDYLAAQALCGYLAGRNTHSRDTRADIVAESCYAYADALLEERGGK